ncbi:MAG: hypothetical protein JNL08_08340 [Planctomycetes bacterium]|nr:hypothetical protein [Planctomycetota bacterium]
MSRKGTGKRNDEPAGGEPSGLQRDLFERERQLRDLTEQSLGFLEELAEARRQLGDRERLVARIGELERLLADTRQRLAHGGGVAPDRSAAAAPLAIVFWGEGSLAAATAHRTAGGDLPVCWVGVPADVPADFADAGVTLLVHRDATTPAQCWNLGLAGTSAEAVLFVGPGVRVAAAAVPAVPAANVALLAPSVARGEATAVGCVEADTLLRLVPRPVPKPAGPAPFPVPWAAPEAFVVRRAAFASVGAFDEGLLGATSLLDWTLRARRANFDVVGTTALELVADPAQAVAAPDRERLFVLAQHRPDQVARALADLPELWQLGPGELAGFVAAVLARLPAGDAAAQRAVLDRISIGLVQHSLPAHQVCVLVQSSRIALLRSCIDAGLLQGDELEAALHRAETQLVTPAAAAFEALGRDITLCRGAATATARVLEQTRAERREIDAQRHAQSDRAERAEGARASVAQQLEQVQVWLREAQAELKRVQERRQEAERELGEARLAAQRNADEAKRSADEAKRSADEAKRNADEAKRLEQQLRALQQARQQDESRLQAAQRDQQALAAQLQAVQQRAVDAERRLAALQQGHVALEREYQAADRELRAVHEHTAELARIVGFVRGVDREGMRNRLQFLQQEAEKFAQTLRTAGAADERALLASVKQLADELADRDRTLREREQWIALLLREVASRRLFPRQLQEHERAFLDRLGKPS